MTITVTNLISAVSTVGGTSVETASISPSANATLIANCWNSNGSGDDSSGVATIVGLSLSWTLVRNPVEAYDRQSMWVASTGSSPGSGTITFDTGAQSQANFSWIIDQVTSADNASPVVQSVQDVQGTTGTSHTITLAAFASSENGTYGAFGGSNDNSTSTPGTGFAELADINHTNSGYGVRMTEWRNDNDTTVDVSYSGSVFRTGIAIELKVAAAGTVIPIFMNLYRQRRN